MVQMLHLHLSREDGERPALVKIKAGNCPEERYLPERNFKKIKMYLAYSCLWRHPCGTCIEVRVAERLVQNCPEYAHQVQAFEATQM